MLDMLEAMKYIENEGDVDKAKLGGVAANRFAAAPCIRKN